MSTVSADVFERSPYQAPAADLVRAAEQTDDKLFSAEGRIGVLRYNTRVLQAMMAMGVTMGLSFAAYLSGSNVALAIAGIPTLIVVVMAVAMMVYSSIKRLHDIGFSGWYYLIGMIPIVGALWTLFFALKPGKKDDNKFGAIREATQVDKVCGVLGIVVTFAISIFAVIPTGA